MNTRCSYRELYFIITNFRHLKFCRKFERKTDECEQSDGELGQMAVNEENGVANLMPAGGLREREANSVNNGK